VTSVATYFQQTAVLRLAGAAETFWRQYFPVFSPAQEMQGEAGAAQREFPATATRLQAQSFL
jgi:hypothetical protein